jgi:hypothetical protein
MAMQLEFVQCIQFLLYYATNRASPYKVIFKSFKKVKDVTEASKHHFKCCKEEFLPNHGTLTNILFFFSISPSMLSSMFLFK